MRAGYTDLTITVALNVAVPTSGVYFVDNLRFIPVAANACGGKPNGLACTDGNACTQRDTCQAGVCRPGSPLVCPAPDQCHTAATCNPTTGMCSNPTKPDNSLCDDGDACTQSDSCQAGSCVGSNPKTCTALDQCHEAGTCDPKSGVCSDPAKTDGSTCDDGNACTQSDSCQTGACVGANPKACAALDQCHVAGVCDPGTGICSDPVKDDGSACDDGNACTQTDACQAGGCVGGNPIICAALDQCHVSGTCDPGTGLCSQPVVMDGSPCNDGNACTQVDACQTGTCVGTSPKECVALDQCHVPGLCDPSTGICSNPASPDGNPCNDGDACTQTDACLAGSCAGSNPKVCVATDQCHLAGTCDPTSGACSNPASPDGSPCNDGNACTQGDTCAQGACSGGAPKVCVRIDACHEDGVCDPATGQCSEVTVSCDDQNPCTKDDCDPQACRPEECGAKNGCGHVLTYDPNTCPEPAPAPLVTITNALIATETGIIKAGETIPVTFNLQATAEQTDFSVEFVLFPVELSSSDAEIPGIGLGGTRLATVAAGASEHKIHLILPADVPAGQYQLNAHKYTDGEGLFWEGTAIYTIESAPILPSFDLSGYQADSVSLFIDQESTVDPNSPALYRPLDLFGTLELVARSQDATQVPVRAYVTRPDNSGTLLPLQIWDFKNKAYVTTLLVDGLKADQPQDVLLDLAAAESVAEQLRALVPEQTPVNTQILVTVNEDASLAEGDCAGAPQDCKHQITFPATLFVPPPDPQVLQAKMMSARKGLHAMEATSSAPLRYQYLWQKNGGNQYFRAGIQFSALAEMSADGFTTRVEGSIPVSVVGIGFDALFANLAVTAPLDTPASVSGGIGFLCSSGSCIFPAYSFDALGELEEEFSQKIAGYSTVVVVVVVPVTLQMGVDAKLTIAGSLGATPGAGQFAAITLTPSLIPSVEGWASGGVGIPGLSGGAEARVVLVGATLEAPISGEITAYNSHPNGKVVTGTLREKMTVSGQMLNGTVGLYAEYPTIKWCRAWRIKYPCGIRINRVTKDICSWPGIQLGPWTLYDKQQSLTINTCKPNTCPASTCGTMDDGCGGTLACSTCPAGQHCSENACVPDPVSDAGVNEDGGTSNPDTGADPLATLCLSTGGQVISRNCCTGASPFPETCGGSVGACGCGPGSSAPMDTCSCPAGACFSRTVGCTPDVVGDVVFTGSDLTTQVGNPGGGVAADAACPPGQALIGFEGSLGSVWGISIHRQITAHCGTVKIVGTSVITTAGTNLTTLGRPGESPWTSDCPPNQVVVGFSGRAGSLVDQLAFTCAPLVASSVTSGAALTVGPATTLTAVGGVGGSAFTPVSCPANEVATMVRVRTGDDMDAFGLACAAGTIGPLSQP